MKYAVLGSGRQGVASGYDLGKFGNAQSVMMWDMDETTAINAAKRLNKLLHTDIFSGEKLDDLANPDLSLWVLGRSDGKWCRLWNHTWSDNVDQGNEPDHAAFMKRRAQIRAGLRHSVSITNRPPEETYGFRNSSAGCQQRAF